MLRMKLTLNLWFLHVTVLMQQCLGCKDRNTCEKLKITVEKQNISISIYNSKSLPKIIIMERSVFDWLLNHNINNCLYIIYIKTFSSQTNSIYQMEGTLIDLILKDKFIVVVFFKSALKSYSHIYVHQKSYWLLYWFHIFILVMKFHCK